MKLEHMFALAGATAYVGIKLAQYAVGKAKALMNKGGLK